MIKFWSELSRLIQYEVISFFIRSVRKGNIFVNSSFSLFGIDSYEGVILNFSSSRLLYASAPRVIFGYLIRAIISRRDESLSVDIFSEGKYISSAH